VKVIWGGGRKKGANPKNQEKGTPEKDDSLPKPGSTGEEKNEGLKKKNCPL